MKYYNYIKLFFFCLMIKSTVVFADQVTLHGNNALYDMRNQDTFSTTNSIVVNLALEGDLQSSPISMVLFAKQAQNTNRCYLYCNDNGANNATDCFLFSSYVEKYPSFKKFFNDMLDQCSVENNI